MKTKLKEYQGKQAGTELCQAQSKLIQIGRVVRKKIEVGKKFGWKNILGRKIIWVQKHSSIEKFLG